MSKRTQIGPSRLGQFWVLGTGRKLSFNWRRLSSVDQLASWEQVLGELLGGNEHCRFACASLDEQSEASLLDLVEKERLAAYISYQLQDPLLRARMEHLLSNEFRRKLRRQVLQETESWSAQLDRFSRLEDTLKGIPGVIWLKGPGLSVQVYPEPQLRQSGDFDLLVAEASADAVEQALLNAGYWSDKNARIETGIAPSANLREVRLQPNDQYVSTDALVFRSNQGEFVELKLDPLDRGLKMITLDQLIAQAVSVQFAGRTIRCPGLEYQLLIACCHLRKDLFSSYRRLLDIHLIAKQLTKVGIDWQQFITLAEVEGVADSVWAALTLAAERFGTQLNTGVLESLRPKALWAPWLTFTLNYMFLWNYNSLATLIVQVLLCRDRKRKLQALVGSVLPSPDFLAAYYFRLHRPPNILMHMRALVLHWFVLVMPASITKRTIGLYLWKDPVTYTHETIAARTQRSNLGSK
jgi:hypothetical protein